MVLEQVVAHHADLVLPLISTPLLPPGLEIVAFVLGHLCYSCPSNLFSCFGKIYGFMLDLGNIDFSFGFCCYCCCFFNNFGAY
jgi:hypothetical protein